MPKDVTRDTLDRYYHTLWKREILLRDGNTCIDCGAPAQPRYIISSTEYTRLTPEQRGNPTTGAMLCATCREIRYKIITAR